MSKSNTSALSSPKSNIDKLELVNEKQELMEQVDSLRIAVEALIKEKTEIKKSFKTNKALYEDKASDLSYIQAKIEISQKELNDLKESESIIIDTINTLKTERGTLVKQKEQAILDKNTTIKSIEAALKAREQESIAEAQKKSQSIIDSAKDYAKNTSKEADDLYIKAASEKAADSLELEKIKIEIFKNSALNETLKIEVAKSEAIFTERNTEILKLITAKDKLTENIVSLDIDKKNLETILEEKKAVIEKNQIEGIKLSNIIEDAEKDIENLKIEQKDLAVKVMALKTTETSFHILTKQQKQAKLQEELETKQLKNDQKKVDKLQKELSEKLVEVKEQKEELEFEISKNKTAEFGFNLEQEKFGLELGKVKLSLDKSELKNLKVIKDFNEVSRSNSILEDCVELIINPPLDFKISEFSGVPFGNPEQDIADIQIVGVASTDQI